MRVDAWMPGFIERHMSRHPRPDWPSGPDFWRAWVGNFVLHGLTPEVADEASERLAGDPPQYLGEHLPRLLTLARAIFRERAEAAGPEMTDDRSAALLKSFDCDDCSGQGLATRYRHRSAGPDMPATITLYCTCPMGRWIEREHRRDCPEVRRRLYDLEQNPFLRLGPVPWSDRPDNRHRYHPDEWDDYHDRPIPRPRHVPRPSAARLAEAMDAEAPATAPAASPRHAGPHRRPEHAPAAPTQQRGSWGPPPDWGDEPPF